MSISGQYFVDNLINSLTKKKQNSYDSIRPALVPDMIPESFVSSPRNLNIRKGPSEIANYNEFSSNKLDQFHNDSNRENRILKTGTVPLTQNGVNTTRKDEAHDTLSSPLSSANLISSDEVKDHNEFVDNITNSDAFDQVNNTSERKKDVDHEYDHVGLEIKKTKERVQNRPSAYFSSSEDREIMHSTNIEKDIVKKDDSLNSDNVENVNNNLLDKGSRDTQENNNDFTREYSANDTYDNLRNEGNKTSKENEISNNAPIPSNSGGIEAKLDSKMVQSSPENLKRPKDRLSQLGADSPLRYFYLRDHQETHNNNTVKVKRTILTEEQSLNGFKKSANNDHYFSKPPNPAAINKVTASSSPSQTSNREEPSVTIHIGRIEVHAAPPLELEESNDLYNDYQFSQQSQNHFQRLTLTDYLKKRSEGRL